MAWSGPGRTVCQRHVFPPGTFEAAVRGEAVPTGCMVHFVIPAVNAGQVVAAESVPVVDGDTLETFAARMHAAEHRLIVRAIARVLSALG